MKKILSLILAIVMALGCMSITAFAADNATTVTATVQAMSYEIVIPTSGAAMTAENHAAGVILGAGVTDGTTKAGVENVQFAGASDLIYYTATLNDFSDGSGNTMAANYTYAQGGDYAALTGETKVTVFDGSKEGNAKYADSTVKVSVTDEVWNAAAAGTYTATVTFNFDTEKAETAVAKTIADILPDDFPVSGMNGWKSKTGMGNVYAGDGEFRVVGPTELNLSFATDLTPTDGGNYTCTDSNEITWTFTMNGNKFNKITISGAGMMMDGEYYEGALDS